MILLLVSADVYRGCSDNFRESLVNTTYIGCKYQHWRGKTNKEKSLWCFVDGDRGNYQSVAELWGLYGNLNNGDSGGSVNDNGNDRQSTSKGTSCI